MYKLQFLPIAKKDIESIISYINNNLKNSSAAKRMINIIMECASNACKFPYGIPIYQTFNKMNYDYRCIRVKNYLMFYTIDENKKIVTIVRVLYKKMNIENYLN